MSRNLLPRAKFSRRDRVGDGDEIFTACSPLICASIEKYDRRRSARCRARLAETMQSVLARSTFFSNSDLSRNGAVEYVESVTGNNPKSSENLGQAAASHPGALHA